MQFNINRPDNYMFVDGVFQAMDTSALPADVTRVQWLGSEGLIDYTNATLHTRFIDASPYQHFLDEWITGRLSAAPSPTIAEAKRIKIALIEAIFDIKRQAPYSTTIAADEFSWEADDATLIAMAIAVIPMLIETLVSQTGGLIAEINANIVVAGNSGFAAGIQIRDHINGVFGAFNQDESTSNLTNSINNRLRSQMYQPIPRPPEYFGLGGDLVHIPYDIPRMAPIGGGSAGPPIVWPPIGDSEPLQLTIAEIAAIMSGIANRRSALITTKVGKTAAVNALTSIEAVIAYDATAGW